MWILDAKYTGESAAERLAKVREKMKENGAEVHILTALDDIAWMLNIRGNDIPCNPVVLSYLVLTETESHLFIQEETLNEKVKQYLADLGISFIHTMLFMILFPASQEKPFFWRKPKSTTRSARVSWAAIRLSMS